MNCILKNFFVFVMSIALTMVAGCSQKEVAFFHGGYPDFKPGPPGGADLVEIRKDIDFTKYQVVILDPVNFYFESTAQSNAISPQALRDLRKAFNETFADALKGAYPLSKQSRPNAMRVRVVINNVTPLIQDNSSDIPLSVGGASIKAEFLDSMTNERLGAVIDTKTGYKNKTVNSTDEWEHTKDVFKFWAHRLRNWLDTIHGKKQVMLFISKGE